MNARGTARPQRVTILGANGSVGRNTLDVIGRHPDRFEVFALAARRSVAEMVELCTRFRPRFAAMSEVPAAAELSRELGSLGLATDVLCGPESLERLAAHEDCDAVMAAIVGGAGLASSYAAAAAGKRVLLANKESLVMSGALFMNAVADSGAILLPIDSEHNAIFQAFGNRQERELGEVRRILLTGSGGPLLRRPLDTLATVTPAEACAHPNWKMGRKISVDSATMMNKGLELIEASWLFGTPVESIEVVIHPSSIIHSMVEYRDGSVLAQLGAPDMRTPIAHGLAWPERVESGAPSLDFATLAALEFERPDFERFPCLGLAIAAARAGQSAAIVLNAANEVAVDAFLNELIPFTGIPTTIEKTLSAADTPSVATLPEVIALDAAAREVAHSMLRRARKSP